MCDGPKPISIVRDHYRTAEQDVTIVRARQTGVVCPSQWDAWDAAGRYYYLRHRNGRGSVDHFPSPDIDTWGTDQLGNVAAFSGDMEYSEDPRAELADFCRRAGITLAPDADVRSLV